MTVPLDYFFKKKKKQEALNICITLTSEHTWLMQPNLLTKDNWEF